MSIVPTIVVWVNIKIDAQVRRTVHGCLNTANHSESTVDQRCVSEQRLVHACNPPYCIRSCSCVVTRHEHVNAATDLLRCRDRVQRRDLDRRVVVFCQIQNSSFRLSPGVLLKAPWLSSIASGPAFAHPCQRAIHRTRSSIIASRASPAPSE
jgi:hypothetical protein